MEPPKRAWVIKIEAGGDTLEDAISVLDHYAGSIAGGSRSSVMGGSSNCGTMSVEHDPSMTPEAFRSQLKAYVEDTRNGVPPASVPQDDHDPRIDPRPGDNLEVVEKDDFENTSSAHHYRVLCVVEDHVGYKLYGAAWRGFMHLPAWQEKMKAATVMKVPEGNLQPKSSVPQETTEGVKRGD